MSSQISSWVSHRWQFGGLSTDTVVKGGLSIGHMIVKKSQSGHHSGTGAGGIALIVFQIQKVILDHLLGERIRRLLIVPGNSYDC